MPRAFLCDFDGTVAPTDIGASLVKHFNTGGLDELRVLLGRWRDGEIGSRELTLAEVSRMRVSRENALAYVRTFELDPHFSGFVREAAERGDHVMVVSDGFGLYVEDHLQRAGLDDLDWTANRLHFDGDAVTVEFAPPGGCGRCGNCKAVHVERAQQAGYEVVMVGDGFSDRCGARVAERVIARGDLLEWCGTQNIEAEPFEDFADVAAHARRMHEEVS